MTVTYVAVFLIPPPSAPPFIKGDLPLHMKLLYEDLVQAYLDARRGKSNKSEVIARNENLEDNMKQLYNDLCTDEYHIGRPIRFIIQDPVIREIIALSFRDRIVQHLVHHYLYPIVDP